MTLSAKQLELRRHVVTASQFSTIMGENKFQSPHALGYFKVNGEPKNPISDMLKEAAQRGHELEEVIAQMACRRLKLDWHDFMRPRDVFAIEFNMNPEGDGGTFIEDTLLHTSLPMAATPDYLYTVPQEWKPEKGDLINFECKSTSSKSGWEANGLPRRFFLQTQFQMWILRSRGFDVRETVVAGLVASNMELRVVDFDPSVVDDNLETILSFQEQCSAGVIPPPPEMPEEPLLEEDMTTEQRTTLEAFVRAAEDRTRAGAVYDQIKHEAKALLKEYRGARLSGGSIFSVAPSESSRLKQGEYIKRLENLLRRNGFGDHVATLRKACTETSYRPGYVAVRLKK